MTGSTSLTEDSQVDTSPNILRLRTVEEFHTKFAQAKEYLALHPALFDEARERAQRLGMYEREPRRA
jgi:hypothetical protein